jgi:transcription initiation factor TFIID TATA-box-binding protein
MVDIKIENIIASTNLNAPLDLEKISDAIEEIQFDPDMFPGAIFRMKEPHIAVVLFDTGRLMCTNARSVEHVELAFNNVIGLLKEKDLLKVQFVCPSCGAYVKEGDERCLECGEKLK